MRLVVHINGWPGVGKLTIARRLARRIGARLLDNHTMLNPAAALFERSNPLFFELRGAVKALVLSYAARVAPDVPIVLTDAFADIPDDRAMFDAYRTLATERGAKLVAVMLSCAPDENARRIECGGRADHHKLATAAELAGLQAKYTLLRAPELDSIDLDVTELSPEAAANELAERLRAI